MTLVGNPDDELAMADALAAAARVRCSTSPNPWVGCTVVTADGQHFSGATEPPPGRHAEVVALDTTLAAGASIAGATVYVTLEPCAHTGRTGPCADRLIAEGVARVVIAVADPDPNVSGQGAARLRAAGIDVELGVGEAAAGEQLAPYLHHRRTGRPLVICKLAATLDGRTAAPDGTSQWITGPEARADAHRLRAESDVIIVGAGTVRADDPSLTVRDYAPPVAPPDGLDPRRIVLGEAPVGAKVQPAESYSGDLAALLDRLGGEGCLQVMVEGGARVAASFHEAGLVDRYVLYLAPALFGGGDALGLFAGPGASTMGDLWRGAITDVVIVGSDLRVQLDSPPFNHR